MGDSIVDACEPRTSFWRPLPTHESRTQLKTTNSRGGGGRRGEKTFLARATHAPSSWYQNEKRVVSVEAKDDGGHGGEARGM
jgi:hypothetical protein